MEIKINKLGKIVAGENVNHFLKVIDDKNNTGGFLILTSQTHDFQDGFDSWVEDLFSLQKYFEESAWIIQWQDK